MFDVRCSTYDVRRTMCDVRRALLTQHFYFNAHIASCVYTIFVVDHPVSAPGFYFNAITGNALCYQPFPDHFRTLSRQCFSSALTSLHIGRIHVEEIFRRSHRNDLAMTIAIGMTMKLNAIIRIRLHEVKKFIELILRLRHHDGSVVEKENIIQRGDVALVITGHLELYNIEITIGVHVTVYVVTCGIDNRISIVYFELYLTIPEYIGDESNCSRFAFRVRKEKGIARFIFFE